MYSITQHFFDGTTPLTPIWIEVCMRRRVCADPKATVSVFQALSWMFQEVRHCLAHKLPCSISFKCCNVLTCTFVRACMYICLQIQQDNKLLSPFVTCEGET